MGRSFLASLAAARAAERQAAYAEAAAHYERALELWDDSGAIARDNDRSSVLERATWATFLAGDFERSIAFGEAALNALGPVPDRSRQIRLLDVVSWAEGRAGVDDPEARDTLAAISLDGLPLTDRLWVESIRAITLVERGDYRGALDLAEPLLEQARTSGDVEVRIQAATVLADVVSWTDPARALDLLEEVREAAIDSDNDVVLTDADVFACRIMLDAGMYDVVLATAPRRRDCGRTGLSRWAVPELRSMLAQCYPLQGELAEPR